MKINRFSRIIQKWLAQLELHKVLGQVDLLAVPELNNQWIFIRPLPAINMLEIWIKTKVNMVMEIKVIETLELKTYLQQHRLLTIALAWEQECHMD